MDFQTDLILEATELWCSRPGNPGALSGIVTHRRRVEGFFVTEVEVLNEEGAEAVGKPVGRYLTMELGQREGRKLDFFSRCVRAFSDQLKTMLPDGKDGVLVVGLGNRKVTPDAVGPWAVDHTVVTRHLLERFPQSFEGFRSVSAVAAGVLGTTGVESGELVEALCEKLHPSLVIAVDALAARSPSRLCTTLQLADTGIVPGSGVGNARFALTRETLGIPVLAVGVPTVIRGSFLIEGEEKELESLIVTPKDIDASASELARIIGIGITTALQEGLTQEEAISMLE